MKKTKTKKRNLRGFSLTELLVVMVIVIVMTVVVLTRQNANQAKQDLEIAANQVVAALRLLQNDAVNGKQIGIDTACTSMFVFLPTTSTYSTAYFKPCSNPLGPVLGTPENYSINSKGNILFSGGASTTKFTSPLGLPINANKIILSNSAGTQFMYVCVKASGNIYATTDVACP